MERISTRRNQKTSGRRFEKMQGKVEICGVNTAKLPILKEEEKEALFARINAVICLSSSFFSSGERVSSLSRS